MWQACSGATSAVTAVILIWALTKEDYALYTLFGAVIAVVSEVTAGGLNMAYVRFASEHYSRSKKLPTDIFLFTVTLSLGVLLIASPALLVFSGVISRVLFSSLSYQAPLVLGFIGSVGSILLSCARAYYQVQESYFVAGICLALQRFVYFIVVIAFVYTWGYIDFSYAAILHITTLTLFGLICLTISLRYSRNTAQIRLNFSRLRGFLAASFWLLLYVASLSLFRHLDMFMISHICPLEDLASYGVAFKFYSMVMMLFPAIKTVLLVRTSKVDYVQRGDIRRQFLRKWVRKAALVVIPAAVLVIALADNLIALVGASKYAASVTSFRILVVSSVLSYLFCPGTDICRAMGQYFLLFCLGFGGLLANFTGNLLLIPQYGIEGAALATLASHLFINGCAVVFVLCRRTHEEGSHDIA